MKKIVGATLTFLALSWAQGTANSGEISIVGLGDLSSFEFGEASTPNSAAAADDYGLIVTRSADFDTESNSDVGSVSFDADLTVSPSSASDTRD